MTNLEPDELAGLLCALSNVPVDSPDYMPPWPYHPWAFGRQARRVRRCGRGPTGHHLHTTWWGTWCCHCGFGSNPRGWH